MTERDLKTDTLISAGGPRSMYIKDGKDQDSKKKKKDSYICSAGTTTASPAPSRRTSPEVLRRRGRDTVQVLPQALQAHVPQNHAGRAPGRTSSPFLGHPCHRVSLLMIDPTALRDWEPGREGDAPPRLSVAWRAGLDACSRCRTSDPPLTSRRAIERRHPGCDRVIRELGVRSSMDCTPGSPRIPRRSRRR